MTGIGEKNKKFWVFIDRQEKLTETLFFRNIKIWRVL